VEPGGRNREEIYPRNPHLTIGRKPLKYGQVDNINPAVETVFILLGQRTSTHVITIVMLLQTVYPGARTPRHNQDIFPENGWYSMDLPNLVEKFRSLYTQGVEVFWKGKVCRQELEDQQAIIKGMGWAMTMAPAEEDTFHRNPEYHGCHPKSNEWRHAKYTLRREALTGPILASGPCLYHHLTDYNVHLWQ
jgi:hypothetical protein